MTRQLRSIALPAALALAGLLASTRPAAAHDWGHRGFRSPRAAFAFGVGHLAFRHHVFHRAHFGSGFFGPARFCGFHGIHHARWAPVRHFRSGRFVVWPGFPGRGHQSGFHRRY